MVEAEFWRDAALPFLESRRACRTISCYKPHSHDSMSIGVVDEGRSVFTGAPGGPLQLTARSVVVIPAHRVHACNPVEGRWSYQMLHVDETWLAESIPELDMGADRSPRPVRIVPEPGGYAAFCRLNEVLFSGADPREKEELLVTVLDEILTAPADIVAGARARASDVAVVAPILEYLRTSNMQVALGDLVVDTGLSRFQLVRRFRAVTGLPPLAWQINERIIRARSRLREGCGPAEVAGDLGFADQSHFHRTFKLRTGVTPGEYRAGATH
ncbi:helix-turn-helix domain-containing protein [Nocardia jinanensis]|uniref:AraC family transcriptional regulator n=1 Tax=Nocardia jinanensis TaxID=382504 RepID=A0A917RVG7_9NOCA|nr:AraC family transcriptional regulator [Nocardia jinanensis]GGL37738.1 AraC family transcriptional regulator [Nocardia jinanensis]